MNKANRIIIYQYYGGSGAERSERAKEVLGLTMKQRLQQVADRHFSMVDNNGASYETRICQKVMMDKLYNALIEELETI